MRDDHDVSFLHLFMTEPIYLLDEPITEDRISDPQNVSALDLATASEEAPDELVFIGQNKKNILILIDEEGVEFIRQENQQLLHKILNAVHLSIDDTKLVNVRKNSASSASLVNALEKTPFTTLISFGTIIPEWPVCNLFSKYVVSTDNMNRKLLLADPLSHLAQDLHKKRNLWICLQDMFH